MEPDMNVRDLHRWDASPAEARRIQDELRQQVSLEDGIALSEIRTVAGVDNGYAGRGAKTTAYATVVVFSFPELEQIEVQTAAVPIDFAYVPGLLSFREGPAIVEAFRLVETELDVVLFDAQGIAHPRRLGAASHLGLIIDRPSIGCAKSRLTGRYEEPGEEFGARSPLTAGGEEVGAVLRTRPGKSPLFVSPGHRMTVDTSVEITLRCCRNHRFMPEPTRIADKLVREAKREAVQ